jgi:hypothetical protein
MNPQTKIDELVTRFKAARQELEIEIDRLLEVRREQFNYTLQRGKVVFDRKIKQLQRAQRVGSIAYVLNAPVLIWLSAPFIYGMIVPLALLDLTISVYQHICFRVYKVPLVKRAEYFMLDRHRLPYLNTVQKINCLYCSYGNGLIGYAREILARTEQFWCPIKHAQRLKGVHEREAKFFDYGDTERWKTQLEVIRCDWEQAPKENMSDPSG